MASISNIRCAALRRALIVAYFPALILLVAVCNLGLWLVEDIFEIDQLISRARGAWKGRP